MKPTVAGGLLDSPSEGHPFPVLVGSCPECGREAVFRYREDEGRRWRAGACLRDEGCWWSESVMVDEYCSTYGNSQPERAVHR